MTEWPQRGIRELLGVMELLYLEMLRKFLIRKSVYIQCLQYCIIFIAISRLHGSSTSFFKLLQMSKNFSYMFIEESSPKNGPVLFKLVHSRANCIFPAMAETYHGHTVLGASQVLFHFLLKTAL